VTPCGAGPPLGVLELVPWRKRRQGVRGAIDVEGGSRFVGCMGRRGMSIEAIMRRLGARWLRPSATEGYAPLPTRLHQGILFT
jgi:hypothetical protein